MLDRYMRDLMRQDAAQAPTRLAGAHAETHLLQQAKRLEDLGMPEMGKLARRAALAERQDPQPYMRPGVDLMSHCPGSAYGHVRVAGRTNDETICQMCGAVIA